MLAIIYDKHKNWLITYVKSSTAFRINYLQF